VSNLHEIPWAKAGREAESREEVNDGPLCGKWNEEADKRANDAYYLKVVKQGVKQETADVKLPPFPKLPEPEVADVYTRIDLVFREASQLCRDKQRAYGSKNISLAPGGALNGLRVRMHDKQMRINNLIDNNAENKFESLRDSFMDLACYALIACMVLDNTWPTD
jgi:hypothetical protein